jgi:hypothetical protein
MARVAQILVSFLQKTKNIEVHEKLDHLCDGDEINYETKKKRKDQSL